MSAEPLQLKRSPAHARRILCRLRHHYGKPGRPAPGDPVGGLVSTILSQNTSDSNTERAYRSLRERFPTWHDVEEAETDDVVEAIRPGGLARQKAPRIQQVLREIRESKGVHSLEFLAQLPEDEAAAWLTSLDGVGPKTAACVQLFNLGQDVMPVDTHVHRVSRRLGLVEGDASAIDAQPALESLIPPADRYDAHVLLITHGREVCKARKPKCHECPVQDLCPSASDFLRGVPVAKN